MSRVQFWHPRGQVPKVFRDVCGNAREIGRYARPERADYLVTTSGLSATIEREAAKLGAIVVVLPEGGSWLAGKLAERDAVVVWRAAQ